MFNRKSSKSKFFAEKKVAVRKVVRLIEPIMGNTLAHPYKTQRPSVKCMWKKTCNEIFLICCFQ